MVVKSRYPRITAKPRGSAFLFGPRGVGKSTWARAEFPSAHRVDLLDERLYQALLADPGLFAGELRSLPTASWVVVDEIQRLPNLLNEIHRSIEERGQRFLLLGSSARKLKTAGTNLLAGRAIRKVMFPLLPAELGSEFDLERVLRYGAIPLIWQSEDEKAALQAYVQLYLKEEVKAEALVRNLPGFVRFLPVAALFHGQAVTISVSARAAGAARTTVAGYLEILDDTLLTFRLPAYEARLRTRERSHPKLYWVDPGIVRAVKNQLGPVAAEERGSLFEGWISTVLRAYAAERELYEEIYYWAPLAGRATEVDFLLVRGRDLLAIEVKAQARFSAALLSGLEAIGDLPRICRRLLVYLGERRLRTESDIEVLPLAAFLELLDRGTLWP